MAVSRENKPAPLPEQSSSMDKFNKAVQKIISIPKKDLKKK